MTVDTPYGPIHPTTGPCKDDYDNIVTDQNRIGQTVKLQRPAMDSYQAANHRYRAIFNRRKAIRITGSWRSCADQTRLHNENPQRFAAPDTSRHCRGLAIDVDTAILTRRVVRILTKHGWNRARPTDEPWHFSYYESG